MTVDSSTGRELELRARAVQRLRKRRDFRAHLFAYVMVNGFLVVIWAVTTPDGYFWPIWPMAAWAIGVAFNAWDVLFGDESQEDAVRREMERLRRRDAGG